ncbi:MAG: MlaD family protein [Thermoleophilaceae bacterium]
MTRRRSPYTFASPVLTGTVIVLISVIGIFVTYNANKGLPFVPTYRVTFTVPDAGGLAAGREVRIAGKRVGIVDKVRAEPVKGGHPVALVDVKLDAQLQPLRSDSVVTIRPLSPLAAKYVELKPGVHGRAIPASGVLPLHQARPTVELTDAFNLFNARTRRAIQVIGEGLGTGVAGRGTEFNELLDQAPPLVARFHRVARDLADPRTRLDRLLEGGGRTASELGSAHRDLGGVVENGDVTFGALAKARGDLADSISESPSTETAGTRALRAARPVLADAQVFLRDARPGLRVLRPASQQLHSALVVGIPVLRRATGLADGLSDALRAVDRLSRDPATVPTLRQLRHLSRSSRPVLNLLAPAQLVCNYVSLASRNFASELSEGDSAGTWVRFTPILNRNVEAQPAGHAAPDLHINPYGHAGDDGECEAGNEPYLPGQRVGPVPGNQGGTESTSPPPGVSGK